jgi:hypothetical protein
LVHVIGILPDVSKGKKTRKKDSEEKKREPEVTTLGSLRDISAMSSLFTTRKELVLRKCDRSLELYEDLCQKPFLFKVQCL